MYLNQSNNEVSELMLDSINRHWGIEDVKAFCFKGIVADFKKSMDVGSRKVFVVKNLIFTWLGETKDNTDYKINLFYDNGEMTTLIGSDVSNLSYSYSNFSVCSIDEELISVQGKPYISIIGYEVTTVNNTLFIPV